MQRIEEYNQLLEDSKEVLRKDTTLWKGFLKFATQFTHYQFFDQILIYVQNPKATACATFDQWKKIGRYVRKGEHSIVLLDETGKRGKLRHIFDVTATGPDQEFEYRPKPILPEQREELARKLNAAYSRENSAYAADSARWDGDLEHTLSQIALSMTQEYYNLSPDQAAAQSESTEIPAYYIATATSAMYLLLEKYGFSQEAESLDFSCMNQLDMETFSGVGNAASAILSWTARLVRTVQREQVRERGNEHERNDNGRYSETDHISSGGRFPGSEHRTPGERRESAGVTEVRDDAEKLSEGEQPSGIRESGSEWNTVSGDGEGGRSSGSDQGTGITATAQGRGSDRGTETERSAQMGGTDGILPPSGGGNYSDGTGVQLTLSDYFEIRPTDRENVSDSDTPKAEHEEIQIEQTEQAAGETPAAFVIPESELVRILQRGSGFEGGKIRIAAFYQKESDAAKRAAFLKEEYGIGGWTFQFEEGVTGWVDWNARGLSIKKFHDEDNSVVKLSWLQVEKRIGQLIENDQYFLESEKVEVEPVAEETADEDAEINDEIELDENLDEEEMQESLIEPQSEKEPVSESDTKQNGAVEQEPILSGQNADEKPIAFSEPEKPILDSISGINFRISDEHLGEGSPKQKFRANMDAIHMLKKLETEERNATWQEQEILSKYVGWGGIPEAFDEKRAQWANEYQELKETLTEEEYIAARASTLNAHFTSPAIIRGIYAALERMGFQGGNILEPAMGVGNFFGMLPTTLLGSRLYGIELDSISGRIAQKLYPMANITVAGFETTNQRDFYDVAVGNVPFGNYKVNDRAYNRLGFSIHNYFFAKSLDQIRPGGIIAYVTSHYTMDSKNPSARRYLAQRAKLLGAIRLPDHAFRANAGAEVVADILFLQKREHIVETEDDWIYLGQTDKGYAINTYFLDHPEMILGTLEEQSTQFGKEYTVKADQNQDLSKLLLSAVTKIQGHYEPYEPTAQPEPRSVSVSDRRQQNAVLAAAMESKRLGLCQKSLFVVPNHLTLQWANDFLKLYPAANLLVASKKDFETANRKKFCARIATGDYDAIIIGHSQFERIPVSIERQERLLQKQLDEIEDALQESMSERDQFFTIKQMEKTRKSLKSRLEKLQAQERKDDVVTFEQLGVDRLFVDEAHAYKNLFLYTKMRNVAGLSASKAQKSTDMYMKCRYMDELTGEKGIIFATGTPISNSMTELYTMMRYLQYSALQERGLTQFDAWASTFGETVTASELAPEGTGYRQKTRFSKFFNLPELMNLFKQVADIKTKDQLNLPVPRDETKTIVAQPSELQKKMVAELSERAAAVHNGSVNSTVDNMLKITSDGRKIGLDQRLMNSLLPDDATSKVNLCVGNVIRIWEEGKENRLTQLIFCDNSVPKPNTFNIYDDVKGKLIAAGIPETKIAYIHDADTEVKKKNLFSKVNDGQVRILLGSTQKMGAGTNVQERLIAVHHLDVGWRPADMTQRNGRIIRQGNRNPVVQVYNYVTEGTFDSYLWQTLENKQKFISQIMTSKSPVRSCEDVDEQVLTYAEVKALCAGDDRIKEKMDLEVDIARLRMLKAEHQSMQYRLEDQLLKTFPEQIREKEGIIQKLDADIKTTEQYPPFAENTIFLEILGKVYTDQKEAAKAFLEAGKTCKDTRSIRIGSYRGFELEGYVNVITAEIQIAVKGKLSHPFELSDVPALNLKRLDSALNKLPERMILEKGKLEALYQQREDAQKQLNTPFPQEDELREKTKRLEELAVELDVDAGREPQENEDNEKTTMKISKPTGIRQSRFSRFRRQKDEKEEDADEDIDF